MPAVALRREAGRIRDMAVCMVDGPKGYTMEFAPNPEAHAAEYDEMEKLLLSALRHCHLKFSRA